MFRSVSELGMNICKSASEHGVTSVIIGHRGTSSDEISISAHISRAVLGSVSSHVVNACQHPVTVVKSSLLY